MSYARRMQQADDKQAFSERLKQALRRSPKPVGTPSELAIQFNLRHPHEPITPQSAQKWLTGKARPTDDKIRTLAEWLGVSESWLRFGVKPSDNVPTKKRRKEVGDSTFTEQEVALIRSFRQLPAHRQALIRDLVIDLALDA